VSISKNFVIKHGLEVSTNLILANADTRRVGIAITNPRYTLDVAGGIGATDFYLVGVGTFVNELNVGLGGTVLTVLGIGNSIGIGTALPAYLLDIRSPVSTGQTALYVQGDVRITGDLNLDDVTLDDATIQNLTVTEALNVISPGISTFGGYVDINNSVDISNNLNVVGLTTLGGYVDINANADFSGTINVVGLSTLGGYVDINNSVDISGSLNVVGLSTLGGYVDINNSVDISGALNVVGLSTLGGYVDINNSVDISGSLNVSGIATIASVSIVGAALSSLIVTGISTLGTVRISSGIITATSGIVTYYGDGQYLDLTNNPSTGIGIGTTGGLVGYGITFLDLKGAGVSTTQYNSNTGIATIFFEGGGGGGSISISTTTPTSPGSGDLWYSPDYGRTFIYYDETIVGYGTDAYWVDAAPFNVGIITSLSNVSFAPGSAINPSMFFVGDPQTGFFSPALGQVTLVSAGSSILNINPSGINVTGIVTSTSVSTGNVVSSGIVTAQDFNSLSDINYKTNVETVENALVIVGSLRGVSFDWKESGTGSYGVIAQELQEVLPELVHGDNPKTVNYNGIIGVLIEAIKELKVEVEELKKTK